MTFVTQYPGPEDLDLDDLRLRVARCLGWTLLSYNMSGVLVGRPRGKKIISPVPYYSRDLAAAWEIFDFVRMQGIKVKIENEIFYEKVQVISVHMTPLGKPTTRAFHRKFPIAVCLAFLEICNGRNRHLSADKSSSDKDGPTPMGL